MRFFRTLIVLAIIAGIGWLLASLLIKPTEIVTTSHEAGPQFVDRPKVSPLKIFAELKTASATRLLSCYHGKCVEPALPPSRATQGATNGQDWYFYADEVNAKAGRTIHVLKRYNTITKKESQVIAETDLTSPREAFISPDGKHVAFFTDNISEPSKKLTELWVYDSESNNVRVVAEKLYSPDILSGVHWNSSSTCLWFLANTVARPAEHIDMMVINTQSVQVTTPFSKIDWSQYVGTIDKAVLDINAQGTKVALVLPGSTNLTSLTVSDAGAAQQTSYRGTVPAVQWLEGDNLVYAVQDSSGFTFWQQNNGENRFVAHRTGTISSVRSDAKGEYVTYIVPANFNGIHLYSLHTKTGTVVDEGSLHYASSSVNLVRVTQDQPVLEDIQAVTQTLDDSEIAAFLDQHFGEIIGTPGSHPLRFFTTSDINTIYVTYRLKGQADQRILLKINDAVNTEWTVLARYQAVKADWKKVEGGDSIDPKSVRLYEWEDSLRRWILKDSTVSP